jgi:hypothetical protein
MGMRILMGMRNASPIDNAQSSTSALFFQLRVSGYEECVDLTYFHDFHGDFAGIPHGRALA